MDILKVPGGFIHLNDEAQENKRKSMEYATIIKELQDLLDRSRDYSGEEMFVYSNEEEAIEEAIEAIHRLMYLES